MIWVLMVITYSSYGGRTVAFQEFNNLPSCESAQHQIYEGSQTLFGGRRDDHIIFAQCVAKGMK